jgi:hypothetical protein
VPASDRQMAIHRRAVQCHPATALIGMVVTERPITPHDQYISYWFDSAADLAEFIVDLFAYHYCGCEEDLASELPEVAAIAGRLSASGIGMNTPRDVLSLGKFVLENAHLRWVGTFSQLCAADGETSKHLAKWFRGCEDDRPIEDDERDDFVDFLTGEMLQL